MIERRDQVQNSLISLRKNVMPVAEPSNNSKYKSITLQIIKGFQNKQINLILKKIGSAPCESFCNIGVLPGSNVGV